MNLKRTRTCGELRSADEGSEVVLNGWVDSARDHGGVYFVDVRDRYGITQVQCDPEKFPGAGDLRSETVIAFRGTVRRRPDGMANKDRATGDIEVWADELEILSPTEVIPFEIVDEAEAKEDTRLRHRYLDIRRRPVTEALVLRSKITQIIREVFHAEEFIEVETPLLMKTTPEGARDFIVPSRLQPGKVYALPQSPQLLKQTIMVAGLDRYFQICKCLRDEDLRADRQPEFTQLDMEMSFVDRDDVFAVIEKTIARLYHDLRGVEVATPFRRMSYAEAMERYGIDKPDTRFGLELCDVSDIAKDCGFKVFSGAVERGGSVRAIAVPGGAELPRKRVDKLEKVAKEYGAKGLAWLKITDEGVQGPVAKFLTEEEVARLREKTGAGNGSLLVFVADADAVTHAALAHVRLALGETMELIDHSKLDLLWVLDFPLFEYDEDFGGWMAMHHMFTMPKSDLPEGADVDLEGILGNQYDLVMNGNELGSGSIRIHRPEVQRRVFELIGMSEEETEAKFGWFLRALQYGAPPHGGIALGLDRLVMVMLGYDNIRDVIAFPKNASGVDPMTDSPSAPEEGAFDALGLELKKAPAAESE